MTQVEREKAKLEQIAAEYERKGYRVILHPRPGDAPAFLSQFQLDLVATSTQDNVVVKVSSSPGLVSDSLVKLAEAVDVQSGWRLELIVVNPPSAQEVPVYGELAPIERVDSLLREAEVLNAEGRSEAAAMMAWAAAEAILRRMALASGVQSERRSSGAILKQLYALGLIDPEQFDSFASAMEFRNAFAHGFSASVARDAIDRFIDDVGKLRTRPAA